MAKQLFQISEVFRSVGQPAVTYVERQEEQFEQRLKSAIFSKGQLCLITGPSKTGKTTLYKKVLAELKREPLIIRCDGSLSSTEFWARALEAINFTRLSELQESGQLKTETKGKLSGKIGWGWLATLTGEVGLGVSAESSDAEIRERILA